LKLDFGGQTQLQGANNEETPTPAFFSNTSPFSSYGASGSRLVVTCPVVVEAEDDANNKKVPDAFIGRGASVIRARDENDEDDMDCDDCVGGKKKMAISHTSPWKDHDKSNFPREVGHFNFLRAEKQTEGELRSWYFTSI